MNENESDYIFEKSLKSEPSFYLPDNFAQKITSRIIRRTQLRSDLQDYLYISGLLLFVLAVVAGTYFLLNKDLIIHQFDFIINNLRLVLLSLLLLNFILFADRVLLPLLFNKWRINN
jgi:hypothetical protein